MKQFEFIEDAWLLVENGLVKAFGPMANPPEGSYKKVELNGATVMPSWCDSHTHIVYATSREREFVMRIEGKSYEQIAEEGGGILNSALRLRDTDEDDLFFSASKRVEEVMRFGTCALEVKSGYGLSYESELKMLRVIRRLKEKFPITIKSTFLGAHAIPPEYKQNREEYVKLVTDRMIPEIADEGLADYVDVFCDRGFFTPAETATIIEAGQKRGLKAKIHANELDYSGGVQVGVEHGAISVDHLECVGEDEIRSLLSGKTMPTLLPSTAFFLNLEYAPARKLIDSGLPVSIATDYNPGSTPSGNMPFVISLSCIKMRMLPEEAMNAATINAAHAMELQSSHGSLAPGKEANFNVMEKDRTPALLAYSFGSSHVREMWLQGERII